MDSTPLLVSDLHKSYGNFPVLQGLNLEVGSGAVTGLVGLNGSGKTTTIECLLGLQQFNSGEIAVLGHKPNELHRLEGDVVAIFDAPSLHANLSLGQCLQHAALLCPQPSRSVAEVERLLSIERFHDFKIRQLSLGNKRRASIAQALLGNPRFILLDEPFNGLDAGGVDDVLALISELNREFGCSFLLSSHQLPYLEQVCTHIAILHQGQIVKAGSIKELLDHQRSILSLQTTAPEQALAVLQGMSDVRISRQQEQTIEVELESMDSASLNQQLVSAGIPVSEIRLQRASLANLFRELTGGEE